MFKKILIAIAVLIILVLTSVFLPVSADSFLWGDNFKSYVMEENLNEIRYLIGRENYGTMRGSDDGIYYYRTEDSLGLSILTSNESDFDYETQIKKSITWNGRSIYMSVFFKYDGEMHELKFEGKRWFFGKYSWKMLENNFFPVYDPDFFNTPEAVQRMP